MRRTFWKQVSAAFLSLSTPLALIAATALPSNATLYIVDSDGTVDPLDEVLFTCELTREGWTMFGRNDTEFSPMIRFSDLGNLAAETRCRSVTEKFNDVNSLPIPYFLEADTVFTVSDLETGLLVSENPVICAVMSYGLPCSEDGSFILLTLNPNSAPSEAAQERLLGGTGLLRGDD
ncbi:MAG: COP23 domain-containing protein [Cyanobacteria bacterium]|nr:COP23 domain-containing protein [Cyanobacteriota bacterium]